MRIIFFAGKGGVGKTSVAAATGTMAAENGHRTVIMSLDIAHSLSDIFDLDKGLLDLNKGQPIALFFSEEPYNLAKEEEAYRLRLKLPFILKKDVELNKSYDELIVRIGGFKRHVMLPRPVASLDPVKAVLEGQYLDILFKGDEHEHRKR